MHGSHLIYKDSPLSSGSTTSYPAPDIGCQYLLLFLFHMNISVTFRMATVVAWFWIGQFLWNMAAFDHMCLVLCLLPRLI